MFDLVKAQKLQIAELQRQVNELSINSNGVLLWKISDYSKKLQMAQNEQVIETKSPPFFTHRYGYKLQLSAFVNGNGSGLNTHLSLYIRVLPGEYDSLLEWPFSHDITFNILDQGDPLSSKRSHISVRFTPDPTWKNFQRPSLDSDDDSNLGFGYPKFISHKELKDNNYLKGNALFIKATVDTSRIIIPWVTGIFTVLSCQSEMDTSLTLDEPSTMGVGWGKDGPRPFCIMKFHIFLLTFQYKNAFLLVSSWRNEFSPLFPPLEKSTNVPPGKKSSDTHALSHAFLRSHHWPCASMWLQHKPVHFALKRSM